VIAVELGRVVAVVEALAAANAVVLTQPVAPAASLQPEAPAAAAETAVTAAV